MIPQQQEEMLEFVLHDNPAKPFMDEVNQSDLAEALYAIGELGLWPDSVDSVSVEQAQMCWALIERLRFERFPAELKL